MKLQSYKDLIVWQKSIEVVKKIYLHTESFPHSELYGLSSQMRRAAIAIASNIAEGYGRNSSKEYIQFLFIAKGSSLELETQLIIAKELKFIDESVFKEVTSNLEEVLKMLSSLISKIRKMSNP